MHVAMALEPKAPRLHRQPELSPGLRPGRNPYEKPRKSSGLGTLPGLNSGWQVCGQAVDGAAAVQKAYQLAPDIISMDFSMPRTDVVQAAREIAQSGADIRLRSRNWLGARGLRGAISKPEISRISYAIKAFQRGETFFYAR